MKFTVVVFELNIVSDITIKTLHQYLCHYSEITVFYYYAECHLAGRSYAENRGAVSNS